MRYRASKLDCQDCSLKPQCCPNSPARKIPRSIYEGARDMAREIANTEADRSSRCQRKKVEMLFAHLKRILKLDRLRLRGPSGARDEFHLAATAQNLRKLAKLIQVPTPIAATCGDAAFTAVAVTPDPRRRDHFKPDFFNGIAPFRSLRERLAGVRGGQG